MTVNQNYKNVTIVNLKKAHLVIQDIREKVVNKTLLDTIVNKVKQMDSQSPITHNYFIVLGNGDKSVVIGAKGKLQVMRMTDAYCSRSGPRLVASWIKNVELR